MTLTSPGTTTKTLAPEDEEADPIEAALESQSEQLTAEPSTAEVRQLGETDLARCSALGAGRGWGAEETKWGLLFAVGEVYGIEDENGELITACVLTRYGARFGTVSAVLVAEGHEGRGHEARIMQHILDQAKSSALVLHATPRERPMYEALGFERFGAVEEHVGRFDPTGLQPGRSQEASAEDLLQLARLDHEVYGVHRTALLKRLADFAERVRVLRDEEGLIIGYGALWRDEETATIGPILAPDIAGARDLITDLADGVEGPIRLELDHEGDDLSAWASGHGLKLAYTCSHMVLGGPAPMDQARLHSPLMCALG